MVKMTLQPNSGFLLENTERYLRTGLKPEFIVEIQKVVTAIKEAGYEPYDQLTGYVRTGNVCYITRKENAREMVSSLEIQDIKTFLMEFNQSP